MALNGFCSNTSIVIKSADKKLGLEHYIKHFGTFGSPKMWKMFELCIWEQIYCTHEHITSLWERGNVEVGTRECQLLTWLRLHGNMITSTWECGNVGTTYGNIWTTYRNVSVGWQADMIARNCVMCTVFHVGMLNMHRVHLFLVLHIELAILSWSLIYNILHWTGQQTLYIFPSFSLRSSRVKRVDNIGTTSM
jgi:hypothetical protein